LHGGKDGILPLENFASAQRRETRPGGSGRENMGIEGALNSDREKSGVNSPRKGGMERKVGGALKKSREKT